MTGSWQPAAAHAGALLRDRAHQGGTGVLEVEGDPAGEIYLDRGSITFAYASWCPDLAGRLRGKLAPVASLAGPTSDAAAGGREFRAELMERGHVTAAELRRVVRSAVIDAVTVLTTPVAEEWTVSDVRFGHPRRHWADGFCRMDVTEVQAAAADRAVRMARYGIGLGSRVELCDLPRHSAVVRREEWAMACQVGAGAPVRDLARSCGMGLCDAVESVDELIRAGLCAEKPSSGPGRAPGPDVLHRVLDGLRKLS